MNAATSRRRVPHDALRAGERVPGTIFDEHGHVLLRAGSVLTEGELRALNRRGLSRCYVGADWPAEQEPPGTIRSADSLRALLARSSQPGAKRNCRRHERHACHMPITVELDEDRPVGTAPRRLGVATTDISAGGMAFEAEGYIHPGTRLVAWFEKLADRPSVRGVVRSCIHLGGRLHRIGVEFIYARGMVSPGSHDTPHKPAAG